MNISDTLDRLNAPVVPSPALIDATLAKTRARAFPWRRTIAGVCAAGALLAAPALAVQTEAGYALLYAAAPAAAQFFRPVRLTDTDRGVTMEVVSVHIDGDTARAYIALSGGAVDSTTDLFDSWSFRLPFDQSGACERVGWDEESGAALLLCETSTLDGSPIPTGGKMTFSVRQLLTGKQAAEKVPVDISLAEFAAEAPAAEGYNFTGGSGEEVPMLRPGPVIDEPIKGISITAAGYLDGLFHVQVHLGDIAKTDNHCRLYLVDNSGSKAESLSGHYFRGAAPEDTYQDFTIDLPPEELGKYRLYGDFWTAGTLTEGRWQVTFPLEDRP